MAVAAPVRSVTEERVWRAQPRQREFLHRTEDEVLYGGAAGGGKTDALLIHAIRQCVKHPGAKALFFRRTYADLSKQGAALDRSRELLADVAVYNGQEHRWSFGNGSSIQFGHLQYDHDVYDYQGAQVDTLCWDELTQFSEFQYQYLRVRVRATVPGITPTIRAATNPGGVGHGWVRTRFVDAGPWGQPFAIQDTQTGMSSTGCFVPAKVDDNPALLERDPLYKQRLSGLPEQLRRAYLEGDWDVFMGQVFSEWRREHHVCKPRPIPTEWTKWRTVDYGYHAPMCCLWLARDPDSRRVTVYRELYATGLTDVEQAQRIRALSGNETYRYTVADPSCWNKQPNGTSIANVYAANGVPMLPGNNDRLAGWQRVHEYLAHAEDKLPALQVFETCQNLIRTLPALVYDEHKVEDVDTDTEDHAADALRYGLMGASAPQHKVQVRNFTVEM